MTTKTRYISMNDQAKLIRTSLREALPGTKFSVRQSRGGSINVNWVDGPTAAQVDAIVQRFAGGGFDSSQDLAYSVTRYMAAEPVGFIGRYVFTNRRLSRRFIEQRLPRLAARHGIDPAALIIRGADSIGHWLDIDTPQAHPHVTWDMCGTMNRDLARYSEATPRDSRTARRVGTYADVPAYVQH